MNKTLFNTIHTAVEVHEHVMISPLTTKQRQIDLGAFTCHGCPKVKSCEYAWDNYNLNGDCLDK